MTWSPVAPAKPRRWGAPHNCGEWRSRRAWVGHGVLFLVLAALVGASRAQEERADAVRLTGKLLRVDSARDIKTAIDSVRLKYRDIVVTSDSARQVRQERIYFYSNVVITDPTVDMRGDVGEYLVDEDIAELRGRVLIRDSTGVIRAQRARYFRADSVLMLWGQVDFQDRETRVQADSVRYLESERVGEAWGDVVYTQLESGSVARGPHGFYNRATGVVLLDQQSRVTLQEEGAPPTDVTATRFGQDRETEAFFAAGNVHIVRGATVASADSAYLDQEAGLLRLRGGRPSVREGDTTIYGREIDVRFGDDEVEGVTVRRNARLVQTRSDTLLVREPNVVEGDSAVMFFENGVMKRAVVSGRGASTFVPDNEREGRISLNETTADSIILLFANEELEEVVFVGNAQGTYRFFDGDLDSLRAGPVAAFEDTVFGVVRGDTTGFDFRSEADIVQYRGERVLYLSPINDLHLRGSAEVEYQGRILKAGTIVFDADSDSLTATERPVLVDGSQRIYGTEMGYDMEVRDAYVRSGETQYDEGFYKGERIVRKPDGTLQVVNGQYTSCSLERAHYGFRSRQMKLYVADKAVARPVTLYLGNIPLLYFPFFFNSVSPGRRSGFLQPNVEFGVGSDSRFIRGLDYYWAASNYWDVLFSSEYNERPRVDRSTQSTVLNSADDTRNFKLTTNLRYKVRYLMEGNLRYTRSQDIDSDSKFETWAGRHSQPIGETMKLNGNLDYASSDQAVLVNNENTDYDRARQQKLNSTLTFQRRGDLASTNITLNRTQWVNVDDRFIDRPVVTTTAPNFSVSFREIRLAPRPRNPRDASAFQNYMSELRFTPNLSARRTTNNIRRRNFVHVETGEVLPDTTGIPDTLIREEFFIETFQRVDASTRLSLSRQSGLWFMTVTPRMSYTESYVDDEALPDSLNGFSRAFTVGTRATTTFYGIFRPDIGRFKALRHTIAPDANYSYAAAVSGLDARQSLTLSLRNQLDIKYEKDGEELNRDGLVNWQLSTFYIPGRGTREWSNINSVLTLNQQGPLRISVSQVYDPYEGRIISTQVPFGVRLSGKFADYGADEEEEVNRIIEEEGLAGASADTTSPLDQWGFEPQLSDEIFEDRTSGEDGELGWDLRLTYSLRRENGRTLSSAVGVGASLRPTSKWRIRYRASFDSRTNKFTNPRFTIERDLHCWRASFSRVFRGSDNEWRYYFRIHVVKHQDELFLESGDRGYGGRGYGF